MTTLKFKCTLLSDVILNQKAATEGPNQTLDFIPGSCFLGIVASTLYPKYGMNDKAMEIFHSGKVRFGDAHPSKGDVRGLKVPACMYYPKLKKPTDELYIHHLVPNLESDEMKQKQLKQCRSGFYTFVNDEAKEVKTETNFAIKSAYDKGKRRSKDEQMFGYQSLQKGLEMMFEVEVDNDDLAEEIKKALVGKDKRVGRSRSAQYGLVEIDSMDNDAIELSTNNTIEINGKKCVTVFADGRLIFFDEFGLPTFRPTAEQLGFPEGSQILWNKSQIRTFQYSPWNFQRQCFDADRCGIEKGSVFVVKTTQKDFKSQYVGSYKNEGFGKVIYNPEFLCADESGVAKVKITDKTETTPADADFGNKDKETTQQITNLRQFGGNLCGYLANQKLIEQENITIYKLVNEFVKDEKRGGLFTCSGEKFASQWGQIRSISQQEKDYGRLALKLFGVKEENGKRMEDKMEGYLTHGQAAEKWDSKNKKDVVEGFFGSIKEKKLEKRVSEIMVNLAAEMAKEMRRKNRKEDK